jgi:hypothetical protein
MRLARVVLLNWSALGSNSANRRFGVRTPDRSCGLRTETIFGGSNFGHDGHPSALAVCQVAYEANAGDAYVLSIARIELLGESQHFICDCCCRVRQIHF